MTEKLLLIIAATLLFPRRFLKFLKELWANDIMNGW